MVGCAAGWGFVSPARLRWLEGLRVVAEARASLPLLRRSASAARRSASVAGRRGERDGVCASRGDRVRAGGESIGDLRGDGPRARGRAGGCSQVDMAAPAQVPWRAEDDEPPRNDGVQVGIEGVVVICVGVNVDESPSVRR